ncbi:MAG TPA: hypothetical protein PKC43_00835 [Phycisphaerales bacterium]|nr:hypothetical protein [Phycisphaerales bacterium]HMP35971.1 hypothetical protein [Phycisphaerales bacterium]
MSGLHCSKGSVIGGIFLAAAACGLGQAQVVAMASYSFGDGPEVLTAITGNPTPSGNLSFVKVINLGEYKITFNYAADVNPEGNALINGNTTVDNYSAAPISVTTSFNVPICPTLLGSSNIGGLCTVKLVANANGGAITCGGDQEYLVAGMIDGQPAYTVFHCPFIMGKTGAGSTTTNAMFGTPIPSLEGPTVVKSIGQRNNFTLSDGDKAVFTLMFATNGNIFNPLTNPCPGDVNHDGVVNKDDLIEVLAAFGAPAACGDYVDTDGNGFVDSVDLAAIIGNWGPCPGGD